MKLPDRVLVLGWVAGFIAVSFGCGDDASPSSPLAPSETPTTLASTSTLSQLSGQAAIDEPSLGTDTVDLKSTAATPQTPNNNVEVGDLTPTLTATNARGTYQDTNFNYAFGVYNVTGGGMTLIETGTVAQGAQSTSYQIQMPLENDSRYQRRVRPFLSGAFGPWSEFASFTTPPGVVITPPVATAPINGVTVTNFRPEFNVINGNVEGDAGEVIYQIQVATDSAFSNIVAEEGTALRARGDTNIALQNDLMPETHYYWHVRGRNDGQGRTGLLPGVRTVAQVVGDWSPTVDFFTPKEVGNAPRKGPVLSAAEPAGHRPRGAQRDRQSFQERCSAVHRKGGPMPGCDGRRLGPPAQRLRHRWQRHRRLPRTGNIEPVQRRHSPRRAEPRADSALERARSGRWELVRRGRQQVRPGGRWRRLDRWARTRAAGQPRRRRDARTDPSQTGRRRAPRPQAHPPRAVRVSSARSRAC